MELVKVQDFKFGKFSCDVYQNKNNEFFMTRQQIGQALEYDEPNKQIDKLHHRHKDRLDKLSAAVKLEVVEGGRTVNREMILYSAKGISRLCREYSELPLNVDTPEEYEPIERKRQELKKQIATTRKSIDILKKG